MANVYGGANRGSMNSTQRTAAPVASTTGGTNGKVAALWATGLFAPHAESKSPAIGTIQVKEDVLIPAGSYINLFQNDKRSSDKSPLYRIQVRAGKLRSAVGK
jgi:hypothetical protein